MTLEEKIRVIEAQKKEYRARLMALPKETQQKVEDAVWSDAAELSHAFTLWDKRQAKVVRIQKGLADAFQQVRQFPAQEEVAPIFLMDLHQSILGEDDPINAGQYRRMVARWQGSTMIMSNWASIPSLVNQLCQKINHHEPMGFYQEEQKNKQLNQLAYHPLIRAFDCYYRTLVTHPFPDANKRVSRAVMALLLKRSNYIPMSIYNKQGCVSGAENYCATHQPHHFYRFMLSQMHETYETAFHYLTHYTRERSE